MRTPPNTTAPIHFDQAVCREPPYKGKSAAGRAELGAALAIAIALGACGNPSLDSPIEALGEELGGVPASEFHRPGQPCVLCHSSYENADPDMSVGGTIFAVPKATLPSKVPVQGAVVRITDASGDVFQSRPTNCVGNFWVTKEDWDPLFPLAVEVIYKDPTTSEERAATMSTRIGRDGSCATCHTMDGPDQASAGRVYCTDANPPPPFPGVDDGCAGKAWLDQ
jgi:hypothetical protein